MPVLSIFYGIIIRMFYEIGNKHHEPHIHAQYQEYEAVYHINGTKIEGTLPPKQQKLVQKWIQLHQKELLEDWKLASQGNAIHKINPLR